MILRLECVLVWLLAWCAGMAAENLVITGVTVVDVSSGTTRPGMSVVVADGRIKAASQQVEIPKGARVVPAEGKFLIPGLWDMHVHLSWTKASALPLFIANGVTGVRDMGGILAEIDEWRARINGGVMEGPRIVRAGPTVNGREFNWHQTAVTSEAEARAVVRALHKVGVDFIKIHRAIPREAYFGVADEAKKLGIPFAGHIPQALQPVEGVDAGQATIEHLSTFFDGPFAANVPEGRLAEAIAEFRKERAGALAAQFVKRGTYFTPTLVSFRASTEIPNPENDPRDKYVSKFSKDQSARLFERYKDILTPQAMERARREFAEMLLVLPIFSRAGVTMLAGTDTASRNIHPGFSLHEELEMLVKAGLTPAQALQTATVNPAKLLKLDSGVIEPGKIADLVLLDANPLDDVRNTAKVYAVIQGGRFLDRAKLDGLLQEAEELARKQ